jgi:uncharacterized repeat protein (TIGR01451 family)
MLAGCGSEASPTVPPSPTTPPEPPAPLLAQEGILFSEVLPGVHGVNNNLEFIELDNAGSEAVDLNGWSLWYRLANGKEEESVYVQKDAGLTAESLDVGKDYRVTGISEPYDGVWQLKPRFQTGMAKILSPELMLEMGARNSVLPGGTITYTLTAYNHTSAPLTNVRVEASPPTEGVAVAQILDGGEREEDTIAWVIPELATDGGLATMRYLVAVDDDASGQIAAEVLGDLNSFYDSPPLDVLRQAGLRHVFELIQPSRLYSYIFQGESETIDHILVTPSLYEHLVQVTALQVNADFPPPFPDDPSARRTSDHDPLVVLFAFR